MRLPRFFTPSYDAASLEEYERILAALQEEGTVKRKLHRQVEDGRVRVRYGADPDAQQAHDYPKKRKPEAISRATMRRLADKEPPYGARTQSMKAHEYAERPKSRIAEETVAGMEAYRASLPPEAQLLGYPIPYNPAVLERYGVPRRAANELTRRLGGKILVDLADEPYQLSPLDAFRTLLETYRMARPLSVLSTEMGRSLGLLPEDRRIGKGPELKSVELVRFPLSDPDTEDASLSGISPGGFTVEEVIGLREPEARRGGTIARNDFREFVKAYELNLRAKGETFETAIHGPDVVSAYLEMLANRLMLAPPLPGTGVAVRLTFTEGLGADERIYVGWVTQREHSDYMRPVSKKRRFDYKRLKGASAKEVLAVIPRLARRRKREGRRLDILTHRNPEQDAFAVVASDPSRVAALAANPEKLASFLKAHPGKYLPVPNDPTHVFWYSDKKGLVRKVRKTQAESWARIAVTGQQLRDQLSQTALHASTAKENPMARSRKNPEDLYWFEQYSKSPYGAQQAIPVARRNPKRQTNKAAAPVYKSPRGPIISAVLKRAHAIMRSNNCDMGQAMKQAWSEQKRGAKNNPWYNLQDSPLYLPDTTQTFSALVRGPYGGLAFTNPGEEEFTERAGSGYMDPEYEHSDFWGGNQYQKGAFSMRQGQFSASETGGFQPVNRRNPRRRR
jgi:hypothetical protein